MCRIAFSPARGMLHSHYADLRMFTDVCLRLRRARPLPPPGLIMAIIISSSITIIIIIIASIIKHIVVMSTVIIITVTIPSLLVILLLVVVILLVIILLSLLLLSLSLSLFGPAAARIQAARLPRCSCSSGSSAWP